MDASRRTITLLGGVGVGPHGGAPDGSGWRGRRAELVFAYLAAEHHRQVTHDELADALWPDGLPDTWQAALRGLLTEVRRYLVERDLAPDATLTTAHRGNQLELRETVTVDLDEAREALALAQSAIAAGDAALAAERASRAWALARLPFLPNHDGEWVTHVRRDLERVKARSLEVETRAHAATGDVAAAIAAAERLVEAEPFNEAAHQLRLRVLGQAGDRSGAMRAYEQCRALLAGELGVGPSEETAAALHAAVTSTPSPARAPATDSAASAPHAATNDFGSMSVLVVEDHDFQRRTAVMLLRKLGVGTVSEAADGAAGLEVLRHADRPDVILCDIDMPGMDGVAFIRHVAEDELAGAVIVASALDARVINAVRSVGEGYGLQVLGAVEKPLAAKRLGELLATYRSRPQARPADSGMTSREVEAALRDGRIGIHLQPSVDSATAQVTTADAVPRWLDPHQGLLPPDAFLPAPGRDALLSELAERALAVACAHVRDFVGAGFDLALCVGLAPDSLRDTSLADRVAGVAQDSGVEPAQVCLAVPERALRDSHSTALDVLTRLRVKGFGVSLDEFGVGLGSVEQLRRIPFTEVRLAPLLVTGAVDDPRRMRALEDAVAVGREFDAVVLGRGCETEDDLRVLLELGCDRVQGRFIADAMPGEELPGWVERWDPVRLDVGGRE